MKIVFCNWKHLVVTCRTLIGPSPKIQGKWRIYHIFHLVVSLQVNLKSVYIWQSTTLVCERLVWHSWWSHFWSPRSQSTLTGPMYADFRLPDDLQPNGSKMWYWQEGYPAHHFRTGWKEVTNQSPFQRGPVMFCENLKFFCFKTVLIRKRFNHYQQCWET